MTQTQDFCWVKSVFENFEGWFSWISLFSYCWGLLTRRKNNLVGWFRQNYDRSLLLHLTLVCRVALYLYRTIKVSSLNLCAVEFCRCRAFEVLGLRKRSAGKSWWIRRMIGDIIRVVLYVKNQHLMLNFRRCMHFTFIVVDVWNVQIVRGGDVMSSDERAFCI